MKKDEINWRPHGLLHSRPIVLNKQWRIFKSTTVNKKQKDIREKSPQSRAIMFAWKWSAQIVEWKMRDFSLHEPSTTILGVRCHDRLYCRIKVSFSHSQQHRNLFCRTSQQRYTPTQLIVGVRICLIRHIFFLLLSDFLYFSFARFGTWHMNRICCEWINKVVNKDDTTVAKYNE